MQWKFSGVCEKYEGWMFVEDDRGGLVMIRRELVRTRKCSSNLLFFTLVHRRYVSKPRYGSLAFPASSVPACLHVPPYLPYPTQLCHLPYLLPVPYLLLR